MKQDGVNNKPLAAAEVGNCLAAWPFLHKPRSGTLGQYQPGAIWS